MTNTEAIEEIYATCPRCGTRVVTYWTERGMLSDQNSTLIADWVFHGSCWDLLIMMDPP